jgi:hypothetical protein
VNESRRPVAVALRCLGWLDFCAIVAVVVPVPWLAAAHAVAGLGEFPEAPIAVYLARLASALYAFHGALLVYLSYDVDRYWSLIRFLALAAVVHGGAIFAVDLSIDLPRWWQFIEGPSFAATGAAILWLQHRAKWGENVEDRNSND